MSCKFIFTLCVIVIIEKREQKTKKAKKENWNRHSKLSCTIHERTINNSTKTEEKIEKIWYHALLPHPIPNINEPRPNLSIPPSLGVTVQYNIVTMISLVQMEQCNGCGSVTDDVIFNSHFRSGAGPWVSIPCLLQNTSHSHWLYPPKQSFRKKQKIVKKRSTSHQIASYCLGLHPQNPVLREVDLEPSHKRGSDKISRLRSRRKNTTENKSYPTAWTHKREPNT